MLNRFIEEVDRSGLSLYAVTAINVSGDRVSHFWRSDERENIYSGAKTFTALAVGICLDEGRLSLSDRVIDFFPHYAGEAAPGSEDIRLVDLMHMADGKKVPEWYNRPMRDTVREDFARLYLKEPQICAPGSAFLYSSVCSYMLGRVVEEVSGCNVLNFIKPRLFTPLGILNPQWMTCPSGHPLCSRGLYLTSEEYARLGLLLLNGGVYGDKRIVSEGFVESMHTDIIDSANGAVSDPEAKCGYGYQLWNCERTGLYKAYGMYGQFCVVVPEKKAIIATLAHEEAREYDIVRAIYSHILDVGALD